MDRTAFTVCARALLPLGLAWLAGCSSQEEPLSPVASASLPTLCVLTQGETAARIPEVEWSRRPAVIVPAPTPTMVVPSSEPAAASDAAQVRIVPPSVTTEGEATLSLQATPRAEAAEAVDEAVKDHFAVDVPSHEESFPQDARVGVVDRDAAVADETPCALDVAEQLSAEPLAPDLPRMALPWANARRSTPHMAAATFRADQRVRHAFALADRGALFSARGEFMAALVTIAEANDEQQATRMYSSGLAMAQRALDELQDFFPRTSRQATIDLKRVVARHKTPVLKNMSLEGWSPLTAADRYVRYAHEQLAAVASGETAGSMALFGLGKIEIVSSGGKRTRSYAEAAPALAYFQAALLAHPDNFMAANELAVLLIEHGDLARARDLLVDSIARSPQTATWKNLSVVHARLGQPVLAEGAKQQALALEQRGASAPAKSVEWLEPGSFAQTNPSSDRSPAGMRGSGNAGPSGNAVKPQTNNSTVRAATKPQPAGSNTAPAPRAAEAPKKSPSDWLPWRR